MQVHMVMTLTCNCLLEASSAVLAPKTNGRQYEGQHFVLNQSSEQRQPAQYNC